MGRRPTSSPPGAVNGRPSRPEPTVFVVTADPVRRASLAAVFQTMGYRHQVFAALSDYRAALDGDTDGCLVFDAPSCTSGVDAAAPAADGAPAPPVIFLTDDTEAAVVVQALRGGAADFLMRRTCSETDLWEAVNSALAQDARNRAAFNEARERRRRLELLSDQEREVLRLLLEGKNNRQIAEACGATRSAVEGRRTRLMKKLGVTHLPGLIQFVTAAAR